MEMSYATVLACVMKQLRCHLLENTFLKWSKMFSGRVIFYNGTGEILPGISTHMIGGHSRGLKQ